MSVTRQRSYKRVAAPLCLSPARSAPAFVFLAFVNFDTTGNSFAIAPAFGRRRESMNVTTAHSPDSALSQLALLHRVSGIVSSDMSLQKMLDELVALVVG